MTEQLRWQPFAVGSEPADVELPATEVVAATGGTTVATAVTGGVAAAPSKATSPLVSLAGSNTAAAEAKNTESNPATATTAATVLACTMRPDHRRRALHHVLRPPLRMGVSTHR